MLHPLRISEQCKSLLNVSLRGSSCSGLLPRSVLRNLGHALWRPRMCWRSNRVFPPSWSGRSCAISRYARVSGSSGSISLDTFGWPDCDRKAEHQQNKRMHSLAANKSIRTNWDDHHKFKARNSSVIGLFLICYLVDRYFVEFDLQLPRIQNDL